MLTFYAEWLLLPKEQFRILVMLADLGVAQANLSDMCRYFLVDPQTRNRNALRTAINKLSKKNYITAVRTGNTYRMSYVPKAEAITMPAEWAARILHHEYNTEKVAWENVLKVQLWLMQNANGEEIKNDMIATGIGISVSQVVAAKNVLEREYKAFVKEYTYWSAGNCFFRKGQRIDMSAWWS